MATKYWESRAILPDIGEQWGQSWLLLLSDKTSDNVKLEISFRGTYN